MSSDYEKYYQQQLKNGQMFQDFVVDTCWTQLGLAVVQYNSKVYQQAIGESRTGVEIKYDMKFAKSGNLWIEVGEKARPRAGEYAKSGIYRDDNTWLYCIGNYDKFYIFAKVFLVALAKSGRYRLLDNNTKTSSGFLLPERDADKYAAAILTPHASSKVASAIHDSAQLGQVLYELAQHPHMQLSLFQRYGEDAA